MNERTSLWQGAYRFALVSLAAYGVWAFGGKMSTLMLYGSTAAVFVGLSGLLLHPLLKGERRIARFYALFVPAFLIYSALWCLGWFGVRGHAGEILGAAVGLAAFTSFCVQVLKAPKDTFLSAWAVLFLCHTVGYTLGGMAYGWGGGGTWPASLSRLSWGLGHGLGFGAGLGYVLWRCQRDN